MAYHGYYAHIRDALAELVRPLEDEHEIDRAYEAGIKNSDAVTEAVYHMRDAISCLLRAERTDYDE